MEMMYVPPMVVGVKDSALLLKSAHCVMLRDFIRLTEPSISFKMSSLIPGVLAVLLEPQPNAAKLQVLKLYSHPGASMTL